MEGNVKIRKLVATTFISTLLLLTMSSCDLHINVQGDGNKNLITINQEKTSITPRTFFQNDGVVYGLINTEDTVTRLVKIDLKSKILQFLTDYAVSRFILFNGWIYLQKEGTSASGLYRIKTDGSSEQQLTSQQCSQFSFYNKKIYYSEMDNGIYCINPDGSEQQCISNVMEYAGIFSNRIYYRQDDQLYSMNLSGNDAREEYIDNFTFIIQVQSNESFYFIDSTGGLELHRQKKEEKTDEVLCVVNGYQIGFSEGFLYYISNNSQQLYKMRIDGTLEQSVNEISCQNYSVQDDCAYMQASDDSNTPVFLWMDIVTGETLGKIEIGSAKTITSELTSSSIENNEGVVSTVSLFQSSQSSTSVISSNSSVSYSISLHDSSQDLSQESSQDSSQSTSNVISNWQLPYNPTDIMQDCKSFVLGRNLLWTENAQPANATLIKTFSTADNYVNTTIQETVFNYIVSEAMVGTRKFGVYVEADSERIGEYNIYVLTNIR